MSSGTLSGIFTAILLVLFVGTWIWAFNARRKPTFDAAARMPLEEDRMPLEEDGEARS